MIEAFVTDSIEGALPIPGGSETPIVERVCDEVTLTITCLVASERGLVVRFDLDSPYWVDAHDAASGRWSLALPRYEMMKLLCTLMKSQFMKVIIRREELLNG